MAITGFSTRRIDCGAVHLSVHEAGQGAPVILLHGFPQTHMTWARLCCTNRLRGFMS